MKLFSSKLWTEAVPSGLEVEVEGSPTKAIVHKDGIIFFGSDGKAVSRKGTPYHENGQEIDFYYSYFVLGQVNVKQLHLVEEGRMINAAKYGQEDTGSSGALDLSDEEKAMVDILKVCW